MALPLNAQTKVIIPKTSGQQTLDFNGNPDVFRPPSYDLTDQSPILSYDQNNDGIVTLEEARMKDQNMFQSLDANGDGQIQTNDLKKYLDHVTSLADNVSRNDKEFKLLNESMINLLGLMDQNGDGVISPNEYQGDATGSFAIYDLNKDGIVDEQEMAMVKQQRNIYETEAKNSPPRPDVSPQESYMQMMQARQQLEYRQALQRGVANQQMMKNQMQLMRNPYAQQLGIEPATGSAAGSVNVGSSNNFAPSPSFNPNIPNIGQQRLQNNTPNNQAIPGLATPPANRSNNSNGPKPIIIP